MNSRHAVFAQRGLHSKEYYVHQYPHVVFHQVFSWIKYNEKVKEKTNKQKMHTKQNTNLRYVDMLSNFLFEGLEVFVTIESCLHLHIPSFYFQAIRK